MSAPSRYNNYNKDDTNNQSSERSSSSIRSSQPPQTNGNQINQLPSSNTSNPFSNVFSRNHDQRPSAVSNQFKDRGRERISGGPDSLNNSNDNKRKYDEVSRGNSEPYRPKQPRTSRDQNHPQQPRNNRDQHMRNPRDHQFSQHPRNNSQYPQQPRNGISHPTSGQYPSHTSGQYPPQPRARDQHQNFSPRNREPSKFQPPRDQHYPQQMTDQQSSLPQPQSTTTKVVSQPPRTKQSVESSIQKLEEKLTKLQDVQTIDEIKVIDSRWGVKPKGFEQVSAPRAKLSGLFPLPGYPRPVDFTKLEGLIKDRLSNTNDILNEVSKIDPIDSRVAKTLIVNNIEEINYLKIVEFFNDYLKMIDFEQSSSNNIHSKRKLKDDKTLIIEFNNSECATIINSLNGTDLLFNAYKNDDIPRKEISDKYKLSISRPHEYVVQDEPDNSEDVNEIVKDSPRKISVLIASSISNNEALEEFQKIAPLQGFHYYRQKGTKEPLGLIEIEFREQLPNILNQLKDISFVNNAFFACKTENETPVQKGPINHHTLTKFVNNDLVQPRKNSTVIQLINVVSSKDLIDDSNFKFINEDIKSEAKKFGNIKSMKIPRPANDFTPGLQQFDVPGLGKIFIEFEDSESALKAIMELSGRSYNDRTVLASYFDDQDYKMGLF
ncbi:hypothetical protein KGF54_004894 [Candida jiufengensis]|uniref:uncharacterized protein n=1 Tax=Candida jiufengensis TaxID=497108 RepID=UPI002224DC9C|nr:uncharacterized protein KGF54_004894 [Candida jiufengensis]KAI5951819.1 hypothetical protein KGF54_004894 [Candida jiufengensis]